MSCLGRTKKIPLLRKFRPVPHHVGHRGMERDSLRTPGTPVSGQRPLVSGVNTNYISQPELLFSIFLQDTFLRILTNCFLHTPIQTTTHPSIQTTTHQYRPPPINTDHHPPINTDHHPSIRGVGHKITHILPIKTHSQ